MPMGNMTKAEGIAPTGEPFQWRRLALSGTPGATGAGFALAGGLPAANILSQVGRRTVRPPREMRFPRKPRGL